MRHRDVVRRIQDVALAVLLGAVSIAEIWVPLSSVQGEGSFVLATVVSLFTCALIALRRVWPLAIILTIAVVWPAIYTISPFPVLFWGQFVPLAVAVYSVARHGRGSHALYGAAATAVLLLFFNFGVEVLSNPEDVIFNWAALTATWLAGWGLRRFEERALASAKRAAAVEVESREKTLAAIAEERTRIAREIHDIVAHTVSVMVVQAGAAEQVVEDDPAFARSALATIRSTGSGALTEMRRVIAMLRDSDDVSPLGPPPGIASLASLVEHARATGLDVTLRIDGEERAVPVGLDLAIYRIIQEALTNVRRHASASSAEVAVKFRADVVEVEVSDNGAGAAEGHRPGHGLIGMRERALLYGGKFEASNMPGAGFAIQVTLPVASGP